MPTLPEPEAATIPGACPHDCPDRCSWQVRVENGTAVELVGDKLQPFTRGVLCAKVDRYLDRVYSPERVLHPLRRVGDKGEGRFERVGWGEAIADVAGRLRRLIDRHGATTVLPYSYMGTQGVVQTSSLDRRFFARLGATRLERSICASTAGRGIVATLGATTGMVPEDIVAQPPHHPVGHQYGRHQPAPVAVHPPGQGRRRHRRGDRPAQDAHRGAGRLAPASAAGNGRRAGAGHDARHRP